MTKTLDNSLTLVLNKAWHPIYIKSAKKAISDIVRGCARAVDTDFMLYNWESWADLIPEDTEPKLHLNKGKVAKIPIVIVHLKYNEIPKSEIRLTKKNILLRDHSMCQYCRKHLQGKDFTVDHIIPKSQGGKNTWENMIACCKKCNSIKRDRTPQQAGMTVISKPTKLKGYSFASKLSKDHPEFWNNFFQKEKLPQFIHH